MIASSAAQQNSIGRDEDVGWSNPKVLTIFAVIFLCGAMFGAAGMRFFLHARMPFSDQRTIERVRSYPAGVLAQRLNLTSEQQKAVSVQLDEYAKYYQNIEEERSDVARHGLQAILSCLTADQRRQFNKMVGIKQ